MQEYHYRKGVEVIIISTGKRVLIIQNRKGICLCGDGEFHKMEELELVTNKKEIWESGLIQSPAKAPY